MSWRSVDWRDWSQVEKYLSSMDKPQIPHEAWVRMNYDTTNPSGIDFSYYKEIYFRETIENTKSKKRKIFFNILKKYLFSLYSIIRITGDFKTVLVWNGKYYKEECAKDFFNLFLEDNTIEENDPFGLDITDMETFRQNCLTMQTTEKKLMFRKQRHLLNFQNGYLDTRNMEFKQHTPTIPFTYVMPYSYTMDSDETPKWDKMLNLVTLNRPHLNRIIEFYVGFILSQDSTSRFQYFLLLCGSGENGKSFLIDTLQEMLSEELYTVQKVEKMNNERFATSSIEGKIAIFTDEEDKSIFEKSNFLKELVGGNRRMSIERKYADAYEVDAVAKPIISTNHMPFLGDTTHGFIRRLLVLPLDLDIKKMTEKERREKLLPNKDEATKMEIFGQEFPAIIRKCMRVYRDCEKNGLIVPQEVKELQTRLIRKSNHLLNWMEENLIYTGREKDRIPARFLYDIYCEEIETGKFNKKKLGNFCDDLEQWVEAQRKECQNKNINFIGELNRTQALVYSVLFDRDALLLDIYQGDYQMNVQSEYAERHIEKRSQKVLIGYMMKHQYLLNYPDIKGVID